MHSGETAQDRISADPLCPPPPEPPYFDAVLDAWVLSRYADVTTAFRDPAMLPVGPRSNSVGKNQQKADHSRMRFEILAALSAERIAEWRAAIEPIADRILINLKRDTPFDLVHDFALPWSLAAALAITNAPTGDHEHLAHLSRQVSESAADPFDDGLQSRATAANNELERLLPSEEIPMRAPMFVALSQTLPAFLANAWLALLRHPSELMQLHEQPDLMPRAINELLRYACLARMLFRRAPCRLQVNSLNVEEGERVVLMLASANRDPAEFADPDRLDLTRQAGGQLALGFGPHSCVGAALIRMTASTATGAFAARFASAKIYEKLECRGGLGFRSPASLMVVVP
jgi:cytochrome P450